MKELTDLEITKLCAEAIGISGHPVREGMEMWSPEGWERNKDALVTHAGEYKIWNPLRNDAQAMDLVRKFGISLNYYPDEGMWGASFDALESCGGWSMSINRSICECVAKMKLAKQKVAA